MQKRREVARADATALKQGDDSTPSLKPKDNVPPKEDGTRRAADSLYGRLYEQAKQPSAKVNPFARAAAAAEDSESSSSSARSWNQRLIGPNGGASEPQDTNQLPPQQQQQPQKPSGPPPPPQSSQPHRPSFESRTAPIDNYWNAPASSAGRPSQQGGMSSSSSSSSARPTLKYGDDDDDDSSWTSRLGQMLPPIPRMHRLRLFGRRSINEYSDATLDAWRARDDDGSERKGLLRLLLGKSKRDDTSGPARPAARINRDTSTAMTSTMKDLLDRCQNDNTTALLLSVEDKHKCASIGRSSAVFDMVALLAILIAARQLPMVSLQLPRSIAELFSSTLPALSSLIIDSLDTWVPFALVAALLASSTNALITSNRKNSLASEIESSVRDETRYGSLFLRLFSSLSVSKALPDLMGSAASKQVAMKVEIARLRSFVSCLLCALVLMTVTVLGPLVQAFFEACSAVAHLDQWSSWPLDWRGIAAGLKLAAEHFISKAAACIVGEIGGVVANPVKVAYAVAVFGVLVAVAYLPRIETRRKVQGKSLGLNEDEEASELHARFSGLVSDLGGSSATRLELFTNDGSIENLLERWRTMVPRTTEAVSRLSKRAIFRTLCYTVLSGLILFSPLFIFGHAGIATFGSARSQLRWDSLFDVAVIFLFTFDMVRKTLQKAVLSKEAERPILAFMSTLSSAASERAQSLGPQASNLQLQASVSPSAGLLVKDLWYGLGLFL